MSLTCPPQTPLDALADAGIVWWWQSERSRCESFREPVPIRCARERGHPGEHAYEHPWTGAVVFWP